VTLIAPWVFVQVVELRKQIEPKERDVVTMRDQLQSMGDELQR
jgi:hypothetical protein